MTDQHPLTAKTCISLLLRNQANCRNEVDLMRAAADWQLEQVIQAWDQCYESFLMEEPCTIQIVHRFDEKLKAMRPTNT